MNTEARRALRDKVDTMYPQLSNLVSMAIKEAYEAGMELGKQTKEEEDDKGFKFINPLKGGGEYI